MVAHRLVAGTGREEGGTAEEHGVLVTGRGVLQTLDQRDEMRHRPLALVAQQVGEGCAVEALLSTQLDPDRDALTRCTCKVRFVTGVCCTTIRPLSFLRRLRARV